VVEFKDEVEGVVGVEAVGGVEVEMVAEEDETVVDVELEAEVLDVEVLDVAPTTSENVPVTGSLLPSPEYAAVMVSGTAEGEGV
jgi:hypothetical protein